MSPDDIARIPLRARDGSVRAYVTVDASMACWANQWPWFFCSGYAARMTSRRDGPPRKVFLHREILGLGRWAGLEGDHIDRDTMNCRRDNLRIVTKAQNLQNQSSARGATSAYRGVSWNRNARKWQAHIKANGRMRHLGYFANELEASQVAREARALVFPFATD